MSLFYGLSEISTQHYLIFSLIGEDEKKSSSKRRYNEEKKKYEKCRHSIRCRGGRCRDSRRRSRSRGRSRSRRRSSEPDAPGTEEIEVILERKEKVRETSIVLSDSDEHTQTKSPNFTPRRSLSRDQSYRSERRARHQRSESRGFSHRHKSPSLSRRSKSREGSFRSENRGRRSIKDRLGKQQKNTEDRALSEERRALRREWERNRAERHKFEIERLRIREERKRLEYERRDHEDKSKWLKKSDDFLKKLGINEFTNSIDEPVTYIPRREDRRSRRYSEERFSRFREDEHRYVGRSGYSDDRSSRYSDERSSRYSDERNNRYLDDRGSRYDYDRYDERKNSRYEEDERDRYGFSDRYRQSSVSSYPEEVVFGKPTEQWGSSVSSIYPGERPSSVLSSARSYTALTPPPPPSLSSVDQQIFSRQSNSPNLSNRVSDEYSMSSGFKDPPRQDSLSPGPDVFSKRKASKQKAEQSKTISRVNLDHGEGLEQRIPVFGADIDLRGVKSVPENPDTLKPGKLTLEVNPPKLSFNY